MTDNQRNIKETKVSIITINYKQSQVTCALLETLKNIEYGNYEVIVVDNASHDDNSKKIKELYPWIIYVESKENLGFAGGNNLGLKYATGDYILFLNNDTEVPRDFMRPLVEKLQSDEKIAVVCPKIRFYDHPDTIQFAGYTPMNRISIRNNLIGYRKRDNGDYDQGGESYFAHGAAMMVPRRVMKEVGLMADIYFLYYEELDWGARIRKAGYSIYYVPESLVLHKESISTGKNSPLKSYYMTRNRILYARRNLQGFSLLLCLLYQYFLAAPKNILLHTFRGDFVLASAVFRGLKWNVLNAFRKNIRENPQLMN
jgi:GT2 family glycosyltransferase